ncbi:hypothetical protein ASE40_06495 [Flavobacterium sp. Root935]|uniref:hypothetical protein n=1 Tax=Flavobacterium sp. Root935 TaxID=1736610 RepID=UPI00070F88FC|nr:hypothetical protein [Flavobacterium sp. Root935]KRD61195.1 hypothetical protein ASE40_06495 [Flavobacterium sp. Root935]
MRKIILFAFVIYSNFLIGQNGIIVPPENIRTAFENQYPQKKPVWDIEYGKNEDIIFEAKFNETAKTIAFARYDKEGNFKAYKTQTLLTKLPKKAQAYLKENYPVKSLTQFFAVVNNLNIKSYEAGVVKDAKFYNLVFDQDGEFYKRIQIR